MKKLWFVIVHLPSFIIIAWKTRDITHEIFADLRLYLLSILMLAFFVLVSLTDIRRAYRENQNQIDAANMTLQQFPALTKINDVMQECVGSPYMLLKSRFKWLECDLAAIEMSIEQGLGYQYTQFAAERNRLLENVGVKIYPPIQMPPRPK
jgi:hypothetical protein